MEEIFYTRPNGHRISLYYTIIFMSAIGFLIIPLDAFGPDRKWLVALGIPFLASAVTLFTRLFSKTGIERCRISENSETGSKVFLIGGILIASEEISKLTTISRPGFFGRELQVFTDKVLPATIIVLDELRTPEALVESLRRIAPRAIYKETIAGLHALDWGLWICLASLAIIIISKVFW